MRFALGSYWTRLLTFVCRKGKGATREDEGTVWSVEISMPVRPEERAHKILFRALLIVMPVFEKSSKPPWCENILRRSTGRSGWIMKELMV